MREYHSQIKSIAARLEALKEPPPYYMVRMKLLDFGPDFEAIREAMSNAPDLSYQEIMARYVAYDERRGLRTSGNQDPVGGAGTRWAQQRKTHEW